jgi:hypothetical protein
VRKYLRHGRLTSCLRRAATDKRLNIQVEIGRFDPGLAKNAGRMVRLRGVVRTPFLRDRFQEGDNIFLVWEKLHTHCLDWMVREKANVDAKSILIVLKQLLCTFEMAHARNIHGNIDETSIVVTANDAPWDHAMLVHWHFEMPDPDCLTTSLSLAKRDLRDLGETLQLLLRHCLETSVNARMGEKNEAELKRCDEEDSAESEQEDLLLEDLFNEYSHKLILPKNQIRSVIRVFDR